MPKIASMPTIPKHALPSPKKKDGTDGAQSGSSPEFGKLFREQAGPIQSLAETKKLSGTVQVESDPLASAAPEAPTAVNPSIADSLLSVVSQAHSDIETAGEVMTTSVKHAPAAEVLTKPEGKAESALVAGCVDGDLSGLASMIPGGSGKAAESASSGPAKVSPAHSKEKVPGAGGDSKTEVATALPAPIQMVMAMPILPASPPVLQDSGVASPKADAVSKPTRQRASGPSPQAATKPIQLPAIEPAQAAASSPTPHSADGDITQTVSGGTDFGFDVDSAVEAGKMLASSGDAGSKLPPEAASKASHAVSDRLASQAGAAATPSGMFVAHAAVEAPVAAAQHSGSVTPAGPSMAQATAGNSPTGAPNLYDRIDQGASPVVLHSGAQHVSVGVHDPDLGWLEIQTQSAAGHVDATLITGSGQTHTSLAAQLPAMAQYLEQRDVRVGTLLVHHHPTGNGATGGGGSGPGYGSANPGAGGHHSNAGGSGGRSAKSSDGSVTERFRPAPRIEAPTRGGDEGAYRAVSYISVRA